MTGDRAPTTEPAPSAPRRPTVFDQVLAGIRELIASGRVAPGERLPAERELAGALGVNRSSLREALRTLQAMGMIDIRHGLGVFVRPPVVPGAAAAAPPVVSALAGLLGETTDDRVLLDLVEARRVIEGALAGLAAARATPEVLARLDGLVDAMSSAVDRGEATVADDRDFHLAIARAAGNRVLSAVLELAYGASAGQFDDFFRAPGQAATTLEHHRRIVGAVRAGDTRAAHDLMVAHLDQVTRAWARFENDALPRAGGRTPTQGEQR